MIKKKRGQLSNDEMDFIRDNVGEMTIEDIATSLNRNTTPIEKFIVQNNLSFDREQNKTDENLRLKLHAKSFWSEIEKQFDQDSGELKYFEDTWIGLIKSLFLC